MSADLVVGETSDAELSQEDVLARAAVEDERELASLGFVVLLARSVPHHPRTAGQQQFIRCHVGYVLVTFCKNSFR